MGPNLNQEVERLYQSAMEGKLPIEGLEGSEDIIGTQPNGCSISLSRPGLEAERIEGPSVIVQIEVEVYGDEHDAVIFRAFKLEPNAPRPYEILSTEPRLFRLIGVGEEQDLMTIIDSSDFSEGNPALIRYRQSKYEQ